MPIWLYSIMPTLMTTSYAVSPSLPVGPEVDTAVFFVVLGSAFKKHLCGSRYNVNACNFLLNGGNRFNERWHRRAIYPGDNDSDDFLCAFAHNAASACAVRIKLSHFEKSIRFAARLNLTGDDAQTHFFRKRQTEIDINSLVADSHLMLVAERNHGKVHRRRQVVDGVIDRLFHLRRDKFHGHQSSAQICRNGESHV